jgi:PPOX class probable F420-dependent enzyme
MNQLNEVQREMLNERRIAAVATINEDGFPHLTAVWFQFDGDSFYVMMMSSSVKMKNLRGNRSMALMIESRVASKEIGISVSGEAEILVGEAAHQAIEAIHAKYITAEGLADPDVGPLFREWDDTAVRLTPRRWIAWDMGAVDQQAFGGKLGMMGYLKPLAI